MDERSRILVCGHRGLVGSATLAHLRSRGYPNAFGAGRAEVDFTDAAATNAYFERERPDYVVLAAAKVGGILANATRPADFLRDNLLIETHVIDACLKAQVEKLVFLGSSCIYPKLAPQPIKESYLLTGPLEPTNRAYALAKIAGIELVRSYRQQHGLHGISLMPTNLYGERDNFDLKSSHVLPALIRKLHDAKHESRPEVTLWGSGTPRREFLYAGDLADAIVFLLRSYDDDEPINVGVGEDISIAELAALIAGIVGYEGRIRWDPSMPDGTPRKLLDVSKLSQLGWKASTPLSEGIAKSYAWMLANVNA
ncbi:MAG: GDP-L-fucose synthase [Deltaproteobacteria bacterium]|nr:GDP-L-fucose synthase [Deltaproteobacteria bacterium]